MEKLDDAYLIDFEKLTAKQKKEVRKLEILNQKREALHVKYKLVAIKKVTANEEFNQELAEISEEIHKVDRDIRIERMPFEMEDL